MLAADASPDAQEVASGFALKGGTVHVQACRRSGDAASVPATLEHSAIAPGAAEAAKADAPQLVDVITPTREQKQRLLDLGLDMTEHGGEESLGVVLHGADDEAALRKAGLRWRVKVADLVAQDAAARASEQRVAARTAGARASALPSGRETYRTLADYNAELKDLAAKNPNLVKLFTMPEKTYGGKDVLGIEITENVNRNDGKPAFFNMGVHHAREWPAGELTMEWALELINGYKKGDARATNVVKNSRNIVVPIVNADGFEASRTAARSPARAAAATRASTTPPTWSPARRRAASTGARTAACPTTPRRATAPRPSASPRTASTPTATTAASGAARAPTPTR